MSWGNVDISSSTGNTSIFVATKGIVVEQAGNYASEVDFNNTFSSGAPFVFTSKDPITFTITNRNDPV